MTTDFLHGVEVLDIDVSTNPIRTVQSSVIGIVGTANGALGANQAQLIVGTEADNTGLVYTAVTAGARLNNAAVRYANPGAPSQSLSFSIESSTDILGNAGLTVVVNLATDSSSVIISTADDIKTAWAANTGLSAVITVADLGTSNGSGVVEPMNTKYLAGGYDEPFPLNTPVLVPGDQKLAAMLKGTWGQSEGSLPAALNGIFNQIGAVVVVVRVHQEDSDSDTITNIIGGVDGDGNYTGLHALLASESTLDVVPRIIIAPEWSKNLAVAEEMIVVANRLRAHCIAEGPDTTDAAAKSYRHSFGSRRMFVVDPGVTTFENAENVTRGNSSYVAGLIARIDNEKGFWNSPSNNEIYGIIGTTRAVDFTLGDTSSRANLLNASEVTTIIRKDGFRLWGNRTCSTEIRYAFLSVSRTADMIDDSILRAHMWAVDRNITTQYIESVVDGVNAYLNTLKTLGAIIDGKCWADADLNTPENIANGQIYFDFDFAPPYPAERVSFRRRINNSYLEELLA